MQGEEPISVEKMNLFIKDQEGHTYYGEIEDG